MNSKRPTLKTIAEQAGLGVTTVSRALKDGPEISLATRARVKRIADELGYQPNRAGVGLRTGKTHCICLVLSPHSEVSGFGSSLIAGLTRGLDGTGYQLQVVPAFSDDDDLAVVKRVVENREADGLIMSRTRPQDSRAKYLLEQAFPFVTHGRTELATPHAWHDFDNHGFATQAVEHLLAQDRKRLLLIPPPSGYTFHTHVVNGFQGSALRLGATSLDVADFTAESEPDAIRKRLSTRLQCDQGIDGIVVAGDVAGLAALAACRDVGREPGIDIDVVLKQTSRILDFYSPSLNTVFEDLEISGRSLSTLMVSLINGADREELQVLQAPEPCFQVGKPRLIKQDVSSNTGSLFV